MAYKTNGVSIGSDHRGLKVKNMIYDYLVPGTDEEATKFNISVIQDHGCYDNKPVDYPDIAKLVATDLEFQSHGILVCGSGHGMAIAANRYPHVRAANCRTLKDVKMGRKHNDMNCLCLGSDFVENDIPAMIMAFFLTKFEGGRHKTRIGKLNV